MAGALAATVLAGAVVLSACGGGGVTVNDTASAPDVRGWTWKLPPNFPVPKVPADNPMSEAKVELGRRLFFDRRLSGNGTLSCASCHDPARAFTIDALTAEGATGEFTARNAQALHNAAYHPTLTWANPSLVTLERQMETPLFGENPVEMGINDGNKAEVLARIADDADYAARFVAAFPEVAPPQVQWGTVVKAIAAFERTLISGRSRYDQYLSGEAALDESETRGMRLFFGEKAECFHCHGSFNFNDQIVHAGSRLVELPFHNTGLYNLGGTGAFPEPNRGVFELSAKASDMGAFRAPSLRDVAVTSPYMHDGSVASLPEVLDFYAAGGRHITSGPYAGDGRLNPYKSDLVSRIDLSDQDKADLVAFLKTLTDEGFLNEPKFSDPFAPR